MIWLIGGGLLMLTIAGVAEWLDRRLDRRQQVVKRRLAAVRAARRRRR